MKVKFGLRLKFTLLFIVLMLLLTLVIRSFLSKSYDGLEREHHLDYAVSIAQIVEGMTKEEKLQEYAKSGMEDEDYHKLLEEMKKIQERAGVYYLYIVVVESEEKGIYIFDLKLVDGESVLNHSLGEENALNKNYPGLSQVLESKTTSSGFDKMTEGEEELDSVYVPILNEKGEVSAFVGVDFNEEHMSQSIKEIIKETVISLLGVMAGCFCVLILIVQFSILHPIYQLAEHVEKVSDGNFEEEIKVRGHDELSEIAIVFNRMSKSIAGNMKEMQILNDAYYKYVPSKILSLLGKNNIVDIKLGNEANRQMTIFSFQLADFDRVIRKKSTKEMIDSINQVLHVSVPVIVEQEGMVEGFQNAGFTALFEQNCESALLSAVTICQKLNQMVLRKQMEKNQAGIGIAYGPVTLGIVGQEKRMAAITVSQYRDTACWLQSIANQYQSHILITQTAAEGIPHFFDTYHVRNLGFLYNSYTGYTDRIYDVYDGDSREEKDLKEATKELFEKGVELYCIRDFAGARQKFIAVLKRFRKDKAAKEYLYLCDKYSMQKNQKDIDIYFTKME